MRMGKLTLIILFSSLVFMAGCGKEEEAGSALFNVRLTDSPGNYDEVNIDFQRAMVFLDEAQDWIRITSNTGFYDLMELSNGRDTIIASRTIPTGTISRIWIELGTNNTIRVNNQLRPLIVPSSEQARVFIDTKIHLVNNGTYNLMLDFDAALSVRVAPNGDYHLYPVVRDISANYSTGIRGVVTPAAATPAIYAISGVDSVSTYPDSTGAFLLRGLAAGNYNVYFKPASGYADTTVANILVTNGLITDIDTIQIQ